MALSAATVWECNQGATAANVNGGGFNPTNANGLTDGVIASGTSNSPTLSSVSYSFSANDVTIGAWIYFPTQANITAGWYQITAQNGGVATLSAAVGAGVLVSNGNYIASTVAGCATTAAPTGVTFLVDYSQGITAPQGWTNLGSANGSTTITDNSSGSLFTKVMVGNLMHVTAGTNATAGWYEVVSWTDANNVVLDRSPHGANTMSASTAKVGGASSLGTTGTGKGDTALSAAALAPTGGGRFFIKGNATYTVGEAMTFATSTVVEGYVSRRGDRPMGSTRPILNMAAVIFTVGASGLAISLDVRGTSTSAITCASSTGHLHFCKATNTSTTAGRNAINVPLVCFGCEAISYRGIGINGVANCVIFGCYIHDCDVGIQTGTTLTRGFGNIIAGCVTEAINVSSSSASGATFIGNTLYGAENKLGTGVNVVTGASGISLMNNIVYGFATGVSAADAGIGNFDTYNNYNNNTADVNNVLNWQVGATNPALNPTFTNVTQVTVTTATTSNSGNTLVKAGATFQTSGVTAGRDFVYISSTSGTAGVYGILSVDSETQITLDLAPGASAGNVSAQITCGRNWGVGVAMKAIAYPGSFSSGFTTSYLDMGAVQILSPNYNIFDSPVLGGG